MKLQFADKLKSLRAERGISQEKLADYLGVTYQSVSKWERALSCPDIALLPDIARFFGITVDELLMAEQIDEARLYDETRERAGALFRDRKYAEMLTVWEEAAHAMPNNIAVKEMQMAAYFDTDCVRYREQIVELGEEILAFDFAKAYPDPLLRAEMEVYTRGQAIELVARTYAACGEQAKAEAWAGRASYLMHAQEFLFMQILSGKELLDYYRFANGWYLNRLFYATCRLMGDADDAVRAVGEAAAATVATLYETVYSDDDADYEILERLCMLHRSVAEDSAADTATVQRHLTRAVEVAVRAATVTAHKLTHPLVYGAETADAPTDNTALARTLCDEMAWDCFTPYHTAPWFASLTERLRDTMG